MRAIKYYKNKLLIYIAPYIVYLLKFIRAFFQTITTPFHSLPRPAILLSLHLLP